MKSKESFNSVETLSVIKGNEEYIRGRGRRLGRKVLSLLRNFSEGNPIGYVRDPNEANNMAIWEDHFRTVAADARAAAEEAPSKMSAEVSRFKAEEADKRADQVGKNASKKYHAQKDAGADPEMIVSMSRDFVPEAKKSDNN